MKTFTDAVQEFENASPWLEAQHTPAVVMLYAMATVLDDQVVAGDLVPSLLGQFGLTFRNLAREAPKAELEADELETLLKELKS